MLHLCSRVGPLWNPWAQRAGDSGSIGPPHVSSGPLASLASKAPVPISSGALSLQQAETFPQNVRASAFSSVHPLPTPGKEKLPCVAEGHTHSSASIPIHYPATLMLKPQELRPSRGSALPIDPQNPRTGQLSPCVSQP